MAQPQGYLLGLLKPGRYWVSRNMSWQAIWREGRAVRQPPSNKGGELRALTLWLELIGPRPRPPRRGRGLGQSGNPPLRLWQGATGEQAITVYLMPNGSVRLVHGDVDIATEPGTLHEGETLSLSYIACAEGRSDAFVVINHDQDKIQSFRSRLAKAATLSDALPRSDGYLNVAHVAAIASSAVPVGDLPGVESGAIVSTAEGPRPVDALRAGDLVLDDRGRAHPLRWIEARPRLCLGRTAPILMRAPYFGLSRDLVVTPDTRLLQTGPVVDYLCGTEAVLVEAANLVNGRAVVRDRSRPVRTFYHMMLDDPACIRIDRCPVETAHLGDVIGAAHGSSATLFDPDPDALEPSLPLLDKATARALVTAHSRAA